MRWREDIGRIVWDELERWTGSTFDLFCMTLMGYSRMRGFSCFRHASDHQHQKHGDVTFKTYEVDGGLGALRTSEFDEAENTTI